MAPPSLAAGVAGTEALSQMVAGVAPVGVTVVNTQVNGADMALPWVSAADTVDGVDGGLGQRAGRGERGRPGRGVVRRGGGDGARRARSASW